MADGYAQASGRLAVVNLHVTPGLGNAMGMLYDAQKAGSPILVTAGQHDLDFNATEPILWADLPTTGAAAGEMGRPRCSGSPTCRGSCIARRRPRWRRRPARCSCRCPATSSRPRARSTCRRRRACRRGCAAMRRRSRKPPRCWRRRSGPLIIAGDAVAHSRAHAELVELAETLGAPVYAEIVPSTASFPASHPLFRGAMTRMQEPIRKVLEQYDVLFSVGGDLFTLSLPSDIDPMPDGPHAGPPRQRSVGARQELSAESRDPRRSEGHACRKSPRRCASA